MRGYLGEQPRSVLTDATSFTAFDSEFFYPFFKVRIESVGSPPRLAGKLLCLGENTKRYREFVCVCVCVGEVVFRRWVWGWCCVSARSPQWLRPRLS